jgi:hypothetical protein
MSDGVRPIPPVPGADRRSTDRRSVQRRAKAAATGKASETSGELVPVGIVIDHDPDPAEAAGRKPLIRDVTSAPAAAFAAQLIGQGGQRNGIRGGPPVLDAARSTYLGAEYSGDRERRPGTGKTGKTEV